MYSQVVNVLIDELCTFYVPHPLECQPILWLEVELGRGTDWDHGTLYQLLRKTECDINDEEVRIRMLYT